MLKIAGYTHCTGRIGYYFCLFMQTQFQLGKYTRVESGSDDPDNLDHLGHFFGGSRGSHLQTKLSGSDPDTTCSLENSVGIW